MPSSKPPSIRSSIRGRVAFWGCIAIAALDVRVAAAGVKPPPRPVGSDAVVVQPGEPHEERKKHAHARSAEVRQDADAGDKAKPSRATKPPSK